MLNDRAEHKHNTMQTTTMLVIFVTVGAIPDESKHTCAKCGVPPSLTCSNILALTSEILVYNMHYISLVRESGFRFHRCRGAGILRWVYCNFDKVLSALSFYCAVSAVPRI
jgi:hypothetical protein